MRVSGLGFRVPNRDLGMGVSKSLGPLMGVTYHKCCRALDI